MTEPRAGASSSPSWEGEEGAEIGEGPLLLLGQEPSIVLEGALGTSVQRFSEV